MQNPLGTPLNMGVHAQLGGMGFRPTVHPSMNLFVHPQAPGPSQQQRIDWDQVYLTTSGQLNILSLFLNPSIYTVHDSLYMYQLEVNYKLFVFSLCQCQFAFIYISVNKGTK